MSTIVTQNQCTPGVDAAQFGLLKTKAKKWPNVHVKCNQGSTMRQKSSNQKGKADLLISSVSLCILCVWHCEGG